MPKHQLQSLPPILRKQCRTSLPSYSKGSRGLSVLPQVKGIFTPNTISLSRWLRQCGCRYAIRAGRNLPDKEFRSDVSPVFPKEPDFTLVDLGSSAMQSRESVQFRLHLDDRPLS